MAQNLEEEVTKLKSYNTYFRGWGTGGLRSILGFDKHPG